MPFMGLKMKLNVLYYFVIIVNNKIISMRQGLQIIFISTRMLDTELLNYLLSNNEKRTDNIADSKINLLI